MVFYTTPAPPSLLWIAAPRSQLKAVSATEAAPDVKGIREPSRPAPKHHAGFRSSQGISSSPPTCTTLSTGRRSGLSHTPEFPSWEGVLCPLPGNLLSFRLRSKSMDQKGRAVSETRTVLYSPFSPLFQVPTETCFEQATSPLAMHSGNTVDYTSPTSPSDMPLVS